jgi:predicted DNA-binding transcriptional regulator YafY
MYFCKIRDFLNLVQLQQTGTPRQAARKLGVSERTIFNYCRVLKQELGAPLIYKRSKQSYAFAESGTLHWKWKPGIQFATDTPVFSNQKLERLRKMLVMIDQRNTGTPLEFAGKLHVSARSLHNYLDLLRHDFLVPIQYDRSRKTYFLQSNGSIFLTWQLSS